MKDASESVAAVFDRNELLARCMGNINLAERVLNKFQSGLETDLEELERAVLAQDAELTASIAHRLRGASASAAAHMLCDRMKRIEELARRKRLPEVERDLQELPGELQRFNQHATLRG